MFSRLINSPVGRVGVIMAGYLLVTMFVYLHPSQSATPAEPAFADAAHGMKVWREARCYVCHSLYGLGGHLGPDLTNIHSLRGPEYVRAFVRSGRPGMPPYPGISDTDMDAVLTYLAHIDSTAEYPVKSGGIAPFGRIKGTIK